MSGKKVMRNLFSGRPVDAVPMLFPIIPLGAKIMQVSTSAITSDPALAVQCALQIKQLLAPQGLVLYDPVTVSLAFGDCLKAGTSIPESARLAGNISVKLETTQRLTATLGKEAAVFAAIPGPAELVRSIADAGEAEEFLSNQEVMESISKLLIDLAKEFMENRVDGFVVVENQKQFAGTGVKRFYRQFLTTVGNLADYYGIPLVIYLQGQNDLDQLPNDFADLAFKGILFDGSAKDLPNTYQSVGNKVFGFTVPEEMLTQMPTGVQEYLEKLTGEIPGRRLMLSVPWMMTEDLSVTHIVGLNDFVKKAV